MSSSVRSAASSSTGSSALSASSWRTRPLTVVSMVVPPVLVSGAGQVGPLERHRAPAGTTAERGEQDAVARGEQPGTRGVVERERDRGGGGVAVLVDVDEGAFGGQAELLGDRAQDADVRLLPDEPVDV